MEKEYIDAVNSKKNKLMNKSFVWIIMTSTLVLCSLPIFFFNEEGVSQNEFLISFLDFMSNNFKRIETYSQAAKPNDLYFMIKLQFSWAIVVLLIPFLISFYLYTKVYLCSLGYIKEDNRLYCDAIIKNNNSHTNLFTYIIAIAFLSFVIDFYLLGHFQNPEFTGDRLETFFNTTQFGSLLFSSFIISSLGMALSYIIIEPIAQVRKIFFVKKNKN